MSSSEQAKRVEGAFREHGARILHFAYVRLGSRSDAEDVTAEAFARLATHAGRVAEEATASWLYRTAANLCADTGRTRRRSVSLGQDAWDDVAFAEEAFSLGALAVFSAMRKLPPVHQQVLYLRAVEDLPFEQVARMLGISTPAAKMRFRRAARALRREMKEGPACPAPETT